VARITTYTTRAVHQYCSMRRRSRHLDQQIYKRPVERFSAPLRASREGSACEVNQSPTWGENKLGRPRAPLAFDCFEVWVNKQNADEVEAYHLILPLSLSMQ